MEAVERDTLTSAQVVSLLGVTGTRETEQAEAKANRLKECQARSGPSNRNGGMDGNGRIMVHPAFHGG